MRALIIGGTGPTGPYLIDGLAERGYDVQILHRGEHEPAGIPDVAHIHADPHFEESLVEALRGKTFDLVLATYGRIGLLPKVLPGVTDRLISIGGTAYVETGARAATENTPRRVRNTLIQKILKTELILREAHESGLFALTHFRYPNLYGPRQIAPREWSIVKRLRDGRSWIAVMDGGLTLESRAYVPNAAHAVLLAVDKPQESHGEFYNVADEHTMTDVERVQRIAKYLDKPVEIVDFTPHGGLIAYWWGIGRDLGFDREGRPPSTGHKLLDVTKMRTQLGYRDLISPEQGMDETVQWLLENPLSKGEQDQIGDPFDYAAEDAFRAALEAFHEQVRNLGFESIRYTHQYSHPKAPSVATQVN